jgi:autotransporter translocation and assembly factor TamB
MRGTRRALGSGRVLRGLAWVVLSLVLAAQLAVLALTLWARSASGRRTILAAVTAAVQKRLGGQLTIGALEGDLTRHVVLQQVRVYDSDEELAIAVDAIHADYDLVALVRRQLRLRSLVVAGAWVHVRVRRDGTLNLAGLTRAGQAEAPPSQEVRRDRPSWQIAIGALHGDAQLLVDGQADRAPLRGRLAVTGGGQWGAAGAAGHADVEATLDGADAHGALHGSVDLTLDLGGALRVLEGKLHAEGQHVQLSRLERIAFTLDAAYDHQRASATLSAALDGGHLLAVHAESRFDLARLVEGLPWRELAIAPSLRRTLAGRAERDLASTLRY